MGAPRFVKPRVVGVSRRLVRARHRVVRLRGTVGQDGGDPSRVGSPSAVICPASTADKGRNSARAFGWKGGSDAPDAPGRARSGRRATRSAVARRELR